MIVASTRGRVVAAGERCCVHRLKDYFDGKNPSLVRIGLLRCGDEKLTLWILRDGRIYLDVQIILRLRLLYGKIDTNKNTIA